MGNDAKDPSQSIICQLLNPGLQKMQCPKGLLKFLSSPMFTVRNISSSKWIHTHWLQVSVCPPESTHLQGCGWRFHCGRACQAQACPVHQSRCSTGYHFVKCLGVSPVSPACSGCVWALVISTPCAPPQLGKCLGTCHSTHFGNNCCPMIRVTYEVNV